MITTSRLPEIDNVGSTIDYRINGGTIELKSEFYLIFIVIKKYSIFICIFIFFILFFLCLENIEIDQNFFSYTFNL